MNEFHVKTRSGKVYYIKAKNSEVAKKHVEKKYKTKVLSVRLAKKSPKTAEAASQRRFGPQPPAICTEKELEFIKDELDILKIGHVTLRQVAAAVDYFIQKQEWDAAGKEVQRAGS